MDYKPIPAYPIGGVKEGEAAIHCTGIGYLPWQASNGEKILVRTYYSEEVGGTILSPTDIVVQHKERYSAWNLHANVDSSIGTFTLLGRDGVSHTTFPMYMENNLWFHYFAPIQSHERSNIQQSFATVRKLTDQAAHELWHHRLGHPGEKITEQIHKHVHGVPKLRRNQFYSCAACLSGKFRKTHIGEVKSYNKDDQTTKEEDTSTYKIGQHFHMDFGFVRGSDYEKVTNDGKLVTSLDNYRSYLLVIDKASRYIWVFLTKTKHPPIQQVKGLLDKFKNRYPNASVTTDQGKELGKSKAFQQMIAECNYILKTTGSDSSAQNGLAEKPNQDLARMMRCMLYGAGLDSRYWSYALRHAVYLKNRLPHTSLQFVTPYEKMNNKKPDLSRLKIFGSKVQIKDSNSKRRKKMDPISTSGRFMTYKGTDKIAYVLNRNGKQEKASTHLAFDEACMSDPTNSQPPMAQALQQAGYRKEPYKEVHAGDAEVDLDETYNMKFQTLSDKATIPERGSVQSAGLDLFSAENAIIGPKLQKLIHTDLSVQIPTNFYAQIKPRSGLALKSRIDVKAGVIDSDYRGEIMILLENAGDEEFSLKEGDKIAQMVVLPVPKLNIQVVEQLDPSQRDKSGFGSTGTTSKASNTIIITKPPPSTPKVLPSPHATTINQPISAAAAKLQCIPIDNDNILPTYNVIMSTDPFHNTEDIQLTVRGTNKTLGLELVQSPHWDDRVIIKGCKIGTPARNVKDWIKRLKGATLLKINDIPITSTTQALQLIEKSINFKQKSITLTTSNETKQALHRDEGIPMLYYDQLVMISDHLECIKNDTTSNQSTTTISKLNASTHIQHKYLAKMFDAFTKQGTIHAAKAILPKNKRKSTRLTRRKLKMLDNWDEWKQSEWKQLDQYENQDTFGEPCKLPSGANVLDLLWTYNIKDDGRLKARCVCNGKPSNKNTAIFGYTFAKMLDHVGSRIFWAAVAAKNFIVRGADASNAFAEAEAPKIPLYVRIDNSFPRVVDRKEKP